MVVDAVRTYLDAASGFTELTRKRAVAAAKTLLREEEGRSAVAKGADTARGAVDGVEGAVRATRVGHTIQTLAADLIETSKANRAALDDLIEAEVRRVLDRLDLVRRDEYDRLARRVAELERRLASRTAVRPVPPAGGATPPLVPSPSAPVAVESPEAREDGVMVGHVKDSEPGGRGDTAGVEEAETASPTGVAAEGDGPTVTQTSTTELPDSSAVPPQAEVLPGMEATPTAPTGPGRAGEEGTAENEDGARPSKERDGEASTDEDPDPQTAGDGEEDKPAAAETSATKKPAGRAKAKSTTTRSRAGGKGATKRSGGARARGAKDGGK
ncbi:hypothetical protein ACQEU5_16945 [Marinactinospora thermotolerans]|uniref:Polyhydroxyalkanoate synthesis regulator phasin n=1 Tax=Marinactinospora thermotolerans DSM 45154 TaxID=1122192 RepID=A0A1T4S111_9ACTN|nr:hypothetical protein [Marinactinospora thermotolerans]SKA21895.1 hypothetical protein SAMN02745673_03071 [Marinactinospora thermotolerans DSM 45154]